VSDGTYTWDQVNGSSDGGVNFDASYSTSLRRITVNYYNGPPATGKVLKVTYRSPSAGLTGILTNENDSWLEVAVNGTTQSPRQKLLAVPFALRSASVEGSTYQETVEIDLPIKRFNTKNYVGNYIYSDFNTPLPWGFGDRSSPPGFYELMYDLPFYVKEIISVTVTYSVIKDTRFNNTGRVDFSLLNSQNENLQTLSFPRTEASSVSRVIPINRTVPSGEQYRIYFTIKSAQDGPYGDGYGGGSIISVITKVRVPKSMGFQ
jgi:acylphosphatase